MTTTPPLHNATGGNDDAPSTRRTPRRYSYRVGSPTPIDDFLASVSRGVEAMLETLRAWGYRWDEQAETWTGPGLAERGEIQKSLGETPDRNLIETVVADLVTILGDDHDEAKGELADVVEEVRVTITRLRAQVRGTATINEWREGAGTTGIKDVGGILAPDSPESRLYRHGMTGF